MMCVFAKNLDVFLECFIKICHLLPQKAQMNAQRASLFAHFIKDKSSLHIKELTFSEIWISSELYNKRDNVIIQFFERIFQNSF